MRILARLGPTLPVLALVLVAALPWGLPPEGRFFLPLIPFVAVHYWALRHPAALPDFHHRDGFAFELAAPQAAV